MSFNGSGTYIPPAGQPVVSGTVIQSGIFNMLVADIGNTLNNTLPRDGQASMSGQLKIVDGTSSIPGLSFNSEASSGMYRPSSGMLGLVASGIEVMRVNSSGRLLIGSTTDDGANILQVTGSAKVSGNSSTTGYSFFGGATAQYANYTSAQVVNYAGNSVTYGIALKPSTSTADTNAITFLTSSSTYAASTTVGAIQHQASDAAMNLSGTWKINGNQIASTFQPTLIKPTIKGYIEQLQSLTGATVTVDPTLGTIVLISLTANTTITLPAPVDGMVYVLVLSYGGAYTPTFTSASGAIRWSNGNTIPTPTSVAGKIDKYVITCGGGVTLAQDGGRNF